MISEAERRNSPVGFLDPHIVSEQSITADATFVENYLIDFFMARRNKEFYLVPYNQK